MATKRDEDWHIAVHKVLKRRPLNYEKLALLAPVIDGKYNLNGFQSPDRLLRLEATRLDFTKARFPLGRAIGFARLNQCLFTGMRSEGNIDGIFTECSFQNASFIGSSFLEGTEFYR